MMISLTTKAGSTMSSRNTGFSILNRIQQLICFLGFLVIGGLLQAQSPDSVDVFQFDPGVPYHSNSGDTLKFQFQLGTAADPIANALGMAVSISFPNLQSAPSATIVQMNGTWLTDGISDPSPNWTFDWTTKTMYLDYLRPDGEGQTGHGRVATLCLIRSGGFSAEERTASVTAGIVMVENIDLKMAPMQQAFRVFPNPTQDFLTVEVPDYESAVLGLWNLQGQLVLSQPSSAYQTLDLSALPKGSYWVTVKGEGLNLRQAIVKL